jgi:transcriptional regulator with XRE-family HTH domain
VEDNMIGDRMKSLRIERGLTQGELAKQLNLSITAISHYESGSRDPNSNIIILYSKFFGVSTDYILELSEFKNHTSNQISTNKFINNLLDLIGSYLKEIEEES